MKLEEARDLFDRILTENGIEFSDYFEQRRDGKVCYACLTIRIGIDRPHKKKDFLSEMSEVLPRTQKKS